MLFDVRGEAACPTCVARYRRSRNVIEYWRLNVSRRQRFLFAMILQQKLSLGTDRHETTAWLAVDQAIDAGIFPDRQSWTGGAPRFERLIVSPGTIGDPLEQLQPQRVGWLGHIHSMQRSRHDVAKSGCRIKANRLPLVPIRFCHET